MISHCRGSRRLSPMGPSGPRPSGASSSSAGYDDAAQPYFAHLGESSIGEVHSPSSIRTNRGTHPVAVSKSGRRKWRGCHGLQGGVPIVQHLEACILSAILMQLTSRHNLILKADWMLNATVISVALNKGAAWPLQSVSVDNQAKSHCIPYHISSTTLKQTGQYNGVAQRYQERRRRSHTRNSLHQQAHSREPR